MTMGPEPMSRILRRSVRFGMVGLRHRRSAGAGKRSGAVSVGVCLIYRSAAVPPGRLLRPTGLPDAPPVGPVPLEAGAGARTRGRLANLLESRGPSGQI